MEMALVVVVVLSRCTIPYQRQRCILLHRCHSLHRRHSRLRPSWPSRTISVGTAQAVRARTEVGPYRAYGLVVLHNHRQKERSQVTVWAHRIHLGISKSRSAIFPSSYPSQEYPTPDQKQGKARRTLRQDSSLGPSIFCSPRCERLITSGISKLVVQTRQTQQTRLRRFLRAYRRVPTVVVGHGKGKM